MRLSSITKEKFEKGFLNKFENKKIVFESESKKLYFKLEGIEEPEFYELAKMTYQEILECKNSLRFRAKEFFGLESLYLYLYIDYDEHQKNLSISKGQSERLEEHLGKKYKLSNYSELLIKKMFNYHEQYLNSIKN